ncbi:hypothetical protein HanPSC8_Chr05g0195381 [Helianthus annuus]|nr:hypothetical protein HanPSC8_Chr05g0195381 [Helianthus annuus]
MDFFKFYIFSLFYQFQQFIMTQNFSCSNNTPHHINLYFKRKNVVHCFFDQGDFIHGFSTSFNGDSDPNNWLTRMVSCLFFLASDISALLHEVAVFLAEAMAMSADSFIFFFLSKRSILLFEEQHIWRPFIHLLRNSFFSMLEVCIFNLKITTLISL